MKTKKYFLLFLTLVMTLLLAACGGGKEAGTTESGSSSKEEEKKVIGVNISNMSDEFRKFIADSIEEAGTNYPDFEFIFTDAQEDLSKQMGQIENFITQGVDAIIFMPVDTVSAPDIVAKVKEAGIPFIVVNQTFEGVEEATAFSGSSSIEAGIMQMEEVAKILDGKGNIAIMEGILGHEAQVKRTEGNMQIINQYPDMKVVLQDTAEWSRAEGLKLMENWLQSGEKIDAVVANNDEMAIGALLAIEAAGKLDEIVIAGVDATPAALEFIKEGKLEVSVFQDAKGQAAAAVQSAVKAANGEEVEDSFIPFQLVIQENVDDFIGKN